MNKSIKCLVVDDEPLAIQVVADYIGQVSQLELVATCTSPLQAFQVINREEIDLMFLDIEMPELSGIDFIKSLANPPALILTTAYRKYAFESYEIEVVDYLLKPISFKRFFKAISKYFKTIRLTQEAHPTVGNEAAQGSIFVYSNKKNIKVDFDDILYIESLKDYIRIHTSESSIISKDTITRYEEILPTSFLRIHRSFIVSIKKITAFTHQDIEIGSKEIPIGSSYKKAVLERLKA